MHEFSTPIQKEYKITENQISMIDYTSKVLAGIDLRYTNMLKHRELQNLSTGLEALVKFLKDQEIKNA